MLAIGASRGFGSEVASLLQSYKRKANFQINAETAAIANLLLPTAFLFTLLVNV
jgi:hypothetical protein